MYTRKSVFEYGVKSLAHPTSIAAIFALLLNDHWLRWHHPSWWTGKIGDFAWLIFAPFLMVIVLSALMPIRFINKTGKLAFLIIGLVFIGGKTVPLIHQTMLVSFKALAGWQSTLRLDATDLLMLPGLWIGWKI